MLKKSLLIILFFQVPVLFGMSRYTPLLAAASLGACGALAADRLDLFGRLKGRINRFRFESALANGDLERAHTLLMQDPIDAAAAQKLNKEMAALKDNPMQRYAELSKVKELKSVHLGMLAGFVLFDRSEEKFEKYNSLRAEAIQSLQAGADPNDIVEGNKSWKDLAIQFNDYQMIDFIARLDADQPKKYFSVQDLEKANSEFMRYLLNLYGVRQIKCDGENVAGPLY